MRSVGPRFAEVDAELEAVTALRDKPAGTIRLTSTENAALSVLWPALERFLPHYPDINVEIVIDNGLTDIVAGRFDAAERDYLKYVELARSQTRGHFEVGDAQALRFGDASFDAACACLVLNFVPDQRSAVAEMKRVVRSGGTVAAVVWDHAEGMTMLRVTPSTP